MDNIILSAALISALPLLSIALHVEQFVGRACNPDEPAIIIRGSDGEKITGIVVTDPAGRIIGQAHLTQLDVKWEPKEAYKTRSVFHVVDATKRLYELKLTGFKFNESGEYRVDVKHGGDGSSQFKMSIRKVDERYLDPKIYHDDRLVHDGDSLNITAHPELVLQTGGSLRANVTLVVDDHEKLCSDTSQCTTAIGHGWESGSYRIYLSYRVRYVEQCVRTDIDYTGTVTLKVTLTDNPATTKSNPWMISTSVLIFLVICGMVGLAVIVRNKVTKTNSKKRSSVQEISAGKPPVPVPGSGRSQEGPSHIEGTSRTNEKSQVILNPAKPDIPKQPKLITSSGGQYRTPYALVGDSEELRRTTAKIARPNTDDTDDREESDDECGTQETSAATDNSPEGDVIENPGNTEHRNSVDHGKGESKLPPSHASTSGDVCNEARNEECPHQPIDHAKTDADEIDHDISTRDTSTDALLHGEYSD